MEVQIRDGAALRRVSPKMLSAYLESRGWVHEETWRDRIMVWAIAAGERVSEVLIPLREQSGVYATRISEAVEQLAEIEERSQLDVYHGLMEAGADAIRLRPLNGVGESGWTLTDSVSFLTRARDLVTAAARSAERPGEPVHRGRASGQVTDYVRSVRPLPGYETGPELTLHSQVRADYGAQLDMGDAIISPFERQVTLALNNGLREAGRTVDAVLAGQKVLDVFPNAASQGVSANLCEAVAALARGGHGIGVSISWAMVRPAEASDGEFQFPQSVADVFEEGAETLRQNSPFHDAHITGEIVGLDRQRREEFDGHSEVVCELDGRPVALRVQFEKPDHDEVWRAFHDGITISIDGDIDREGRRYTMRKPRNFTVASAEAP